MSPQVTSGESNSFYMPPTDNDGKTITRQLIYEGTSQATWLMGKTHTLHQPTSYMVQSFQDNFGFPSSVNTYVTWPHYEHGTGQHTDRTNFFLMQVQGRKRWTLWKSKVPLPVFGPNQSAQWGKGGKEFPKKLLGEVLFDGVLEPGDLLYAPRGTIHATSTDVYGFEIGPQYPSIALTMALTSEGKQFVWSNCTLFNWSYSRRLHWST
eukprot:UN25595